MEDDGDVVGQDALIRGTEPQAFVRDVSTDGDDFAQHKRVLAPQTSEGEGVRHLVDPSSGINPLLRSQKHVDVLDALTVAQQLLQNYFAQEAGCSC